MLAKFVSQSTFAVVHDCIPLICDIVMKNSFVLKYTSTKEVNTFMIRFKKCIVQ